MPLIIFVDDDEDDANLFQKAVNEISNQCVVNYANCARGFFDLLEKVSPEFIFLDIRMPDEDGISCLKKIRAKNKYDSIPIVMYSSSDSFREECFLEKANFYIKKPGTYTEIVAALKKVLEMNATKNKRTPQEQFSIN